MGVGIKLVGAWDKAINLTLGFAGRLNNAYRKAALQEGHFLRAKIREGIRSGAPGGKPFLPLARSTLIVRKARGGGGKKPLIRSADLINSIVVKSEGDEVFVGILRGARGGGGKGMANIAEIHEFGKVFAMRITPRAHRFLMAVFRRSGWGVGASPVVGRNRKTGKFQKGSANASPFAPQGKQVEVAIIFIPARPFMTPVFEKYAKSADVAERFQKRIARLLGGDFGIP